MSDLPNAEDVTGWARQARLAKRRIAVTSAPYLDTIEKLQEELDTAQAELNAAIEEDQAIVEQMQSAIWRWRNNLGTDDTSIDLPFVNISYRKGREKTVVDPERELELLAFFEEAGFNDTATRFVPSRTEIDLKGVKKLVKDGLLGQSGFGRLFDRDGEEVPGVEIIRGEPTITIEITD